MPSAKTATAAWRRRHKTRKLEYLIPEALAQGCDTLVSIGGIQSNQTRQVAAVAAHLGMKCVLVQENWVNYSDAVYDRVGNIEMSRILGADVRLDAAGFDIGIRPSWEQALEDVRKSGAVRASWGTELPPLTYEAGTKSEPRGIRTCHRTCERPPAPAPNRPDADVKTGRVKAHVGAEDAGHLNVADTVIDRVGVVDPVLLHQNTLHPQVCSDRRDLSRLVRLDAADGHQRVAALGQGLGIRYSSLRVLLPPNARPLCSLRAWHRVRPFAKMRAQTLQRLMGVGPNVSECRGKRFRFMARLLAWKATRQIVPK